MALATLTLALNLLMAALVYRLRSRYASLAALRYATLAALVEVPLTAGLLGAYSHAGGYSLAEAGVGGASLAWFSPALALVTLAFVFFETKRAPYDHAEAESELVAGHMVEVGGLSLLCFFFCEYVHLLVGVFFACSLLLAA